MASTQRRFAILGDNLFKVIDRISNNQNVCRYLKYQTRDPLDTSLADVDGSELIGKQICIVPKLYDATDEKMGYIIAVFDSFNINAANPDFKITTLRIDVICPYDNWVLDGNTLRPFALMNEIDSMFNGKAISGIGNLQFVKSTLLTLSPQLGGYSLEYFIHEFN